MPRREQLPSPFGHFTERCGRSAAPGEGNRASVRSREGKSRPAGQRSAPPDAARTRGSRRAGLLRQHGDSGGGSGAGCPHPYRFPKPAVPGSPQPLSSPGESAPVPKKQRESGSAERLPGAYLCSAAGGQSRAGLCRGTGVRTEEEKEKEKEEEETRGGSGGMRGRSGDAGTPRAAGRWEGRGVPGAGTRGALRGCAAVPGASCGEGGD